MASRQRYEIKTFYRGDEFITSSFHGRNTPVVMAQDNPPRRHSRCKEKQGIPRCLIQIGVDMYPTESLVFNRHSGARKEPWMDCEVWVVLEQPPQILQA